MAGSKALTLLILNDQCKRWMLVLITGPATRLMVMSILRKTSDMTNVRQQPLPKKYKGYVEWSALTKRTVAIVSIVRHTISRRLITLISNPRETSLELDSHADTCCIGKNALIIYGYDHPVTISGYDPELGSRYFKTISAVLGYTYPLTGQICHLVIYQSIQIPNLDHHLLCPMQCRVNDITINDVPKFLIKTPIPDSHSIVAHDVNNPLTPRILPLYIHGVASWLPVSNPSLEDWTSKRYHTIELTAEQLDWDHVIPDSRNLRKPWPHMEANWKWPVEMTMTTLWLLIPWPYWQCLLLILQVTPEIGKSSYVGYILDEYIIRFQFVNYAQNTTQQNRAIAITYSVIKLSHDPMRVITQPRSSPIKWCQGWDLYTNPLVRT